MKKQKNDVFYMNQAIKQAKKSYKKGEVPVGAIIVVDNKIIARAHNTVEKKKSFLCHAEILALTKATKKLKKWRLDDCILYTTMEPCMMCCGAITHSRIKKIVYGIKNEKYGYSSNLKNVEIISNVCEDACKQLVQSFFKKIR
jgi:tRNA(adenine34) deaminase